MLVYQEEGPGAGGSKQVEGVCKIDEHGGPLKVKFNNRSIASLLGVRKRKKANHGSLSDESSEVVFEKNLLTTKNLLRIKDADQLERFFLNPPSVASCQ